MNLLYLLVTFFKIGLFSVGGGLATLPFLFEIAANAAADEIPWLTSAMIQDMTAVAQSLPGAIGANIAAYVGYEYAGIPGAYISAVSLTVPSIVMILFIARMLQAFKESAVVKNFFSGLRPAAAGLLSAAAFGAVSLSLYNSGAAVWHEGLLWKEIALFEIIFFLIVKLKQHPIVYIIGAGALGVFLKL